MSIPTKKFQQKNHIMSRTQPIAKTAPEGLELATLAGGCFWCLEPAFAELKGVLDVECGYAGSDYANANYEAVCTGNTGLAEVIHILFDPQIISYETLLQIFFVLHDPTTLNRQGNDIGTQYRSAIFTHSDTQIQTAREMKSWVTQVIEQTVVTEIVPFIPEQYTRAEDYHQEYFEHNPENTYCQMVIPYKLSKLRANFVGMLK